MLSLCHCFLYLISHVNSAKTEVLVLSSPFYVQSFLKLTLVLSRKSEKINLVRTFCSSTAKTSTVTPIFLFNDFNKDSASFRWEKIWQKSMFSFLAILSNCADWAITGRIARVQFNSTLERKVKTRALKGIVLLRKWINNALKSNSVWYHLHHRKTLSFLSSFGLPTVFVKCS